jgi:hypothetical protein
MFPFSMDYPHRNLFHSKNVCPLLFLSTKALVSFKKYMPPPLP